MPGVISRAHMDGHRRLAASVIRRAIMDARRGDEEAEDWLMGPMRPWGDILDFDLERMHRMMPDIISREHIRFSERDPQYGRLI